MIDRAALLATLKPLVVELENSIRTRVVETPEVAEHMEDEHNRAVAAERTAMSLEEWRDGEITQAAVAWVLGCVFVRFLEDNRLIDQALISGPAGRRAAALGHREEHFRGHPSHSDREYLEECFREVAKYPAVAALYDERHNPLWRLGPTADGARALRETFTTIDPASGALAHDFTDPEFDTRFLGDLYQDLSETAKKRYALLQTPEFVERFILDRTLTPAIEEFGLEEVRLIDPTCGSGHFLTGAFERLFALWQEREPATAATVLASVVSNRSRVSISTHSQRRSRAFGWSSQRSAHAESRASLRHQRSERTSQQATASCTGPYRATARRCSSTPIGSPRTSRMFTRPRMPPS